MNKFAEIRYGKVAHIYETSRTMEEMVALFVPATLLVDVTNIECAVGWKVDFESGLETPNFIAPKVILPPTIVELKASKIQELKSTRDSLEVEPITYNGNNFDYDEKARDRINAAIIALDMQTQLTGKEASLSWTTADNIEAIVTTNDLRGIIANVALRSNELHIKYRELKDLVESAETKEDLDKIMWEEIDGN